jgi:hypothetical protein
LLSREKERKREREKERKREKKKERKEEKEKKSTYILKQMLSDLFQPFGQAPV